LCIAGLVDEQERCEDAVCGCMPALLPLLTYVPTYPSSPAGLFAAATLLNKPEEPVAVVKEVKKAAPAVRVGRWHTH
jgi:hypothetical protein